MYFFRDDESAADSSSPDDLADDDDEYGKPKTSPKKRKIKKLKKKKNKQKLGKNYNTSAKEDFSDLPEFERPNGGWVQEYKFTCSRCKPREGEEDSKTPIVVVGFEASVEHMNEKHGQLVTPDKQFQV